MAPQAEPIVTVDEIDEAIWWVVMTAPRGIDYMTIVDALLDQRLLISDLAAPGQKHHHASQGAHLAGQSDQTADHPRAR